MWRVARRPRWIAALVFALAVAAGFAALGQWQLSRSIDTSVSSETATETAVPLATVTDPRTAVSEAIAGQLVTVTGAFVGGDHRILSGRLNYGVEGYWVVGHLVTTDPGTPSLAVALGWAPTEDRAIDAVAGLDALEVGSVIHLDGRYLPSDSPQQSDFEAGEQSALAVAQLVNQWADAPDSVYSGFLVSDAPPPGLDAIDSPPPSEAATVNLLNVFYAVEWIVFAGFAVFLWYRLVRDAWQREESERAETAEAAELH